MSQSNRLVIKGAIGNGNFGDDLLIYSIIELLNRMNIDNFVVSSDPVGVTYLRCLFPTVEILSSDDLTLLKDDLILYAGGTQFASFEYTIFKKIPPIRRLLYLLFNQKVFWKKVFSFFTNKKNENEIMMLGVGIGPFINRDNYYYSVIDLLKSCVLLSVRDNLSAKICMDNHVQFYEFSDLVYSLPDIYWNDFRKEKRKRVSFCQKTAVIIRDWDYTSSKESYYDAIRKLACVKSLYYISFSKSADMKVVEIIQKAGNEVIQWDPQKDSFKSFLLKLSDFDLFVTARYHGAVISSLLGKPFVSICIEPKLSMIADKLNMPKWVAPFDVEELPKLQNLAVEDSSIGLCLSKVIDEKSKSQQMELVVSDCFLKYLN